MNARILTARNAARAAELQERSRSSTPTLRTIVVTCADHRVDPADVLGVRPGEVAVLRNPGGRVTPELLKSLLVLSTVGEAEGMGNEFDLVLMHHTDCGLARLDAPRHAGLLADYAGVTVEQVPGLAVADPRLAVARDARILIDLLPNAGITVTALVYDLWTGLVDPVDPA